MILTDQARTALQNSIEHWRRLANGDRSHNDQLGPMDCALCICFRQIEPMGFTSCEGCPVADSTGEDGCDGNVAYLDTVKVFHNLCANFSVEAAYKHPYFREAASKEVAFLEQLLAEDAAT